MFSHASWSTSAEIWVESVFYHDIPVEIRGIKLHFHTKDMLCKDSQKFKTTGKVFSTFGKKIKTKNFADHITYTSIKFFKI